eukprot:tig00021582_g22631.t1
MASDASDEEVFDLADARESMLRAHRRELERAQWPLAQDLGGAPKKKATRRKRSDGDEDYDPREESKESKPSRRSARLVGKPAEDPGSDGSDIDADSDNGRERRRRPRRAGSAKKINVQKDYIFPVDKLGSCRAAPKEELLVNQEMKRKRGLYDKENGVTCHQCRQKTSDKKTECSGKECRKTEKGHFCAKCLYDRYGESIEEVWANPKWTCPVCRGFCNCSFCWAEATGALAPRARRLGYLSVAHYLADRPGQLVSMPDFDRRKLMAPGRQPPAREEAQALAPAQSSATPRRKAPARPARGRRPAKRARAAPAEEEEDEEEEDEEEEEGEQDEEEEEGEEENEEEAEEEAEEDEEAARPRAQVPGTARKEKAGKGAWHRIKSWATSKMRSRS